jgi:hypothetical protein
MQRSKVVRTPGIFDEARILAVHIATGSSPQIDPMTLPIAALSF